MQGEGCCDGFGWGMGVLMVKPGLRPKFWSELMDPPSPSVKARQKLHGGTLVLEALKVTKERKGCIPVILWMVLHISGHAEAQIGHQRPEENQCFPK